MGRVFHGSLKVGQELTSLNHVTIPEIHLKKIISSVELRKYFYWMGRELESIEQVHEGGVLQFQLNH